MQQPEEGSCCPDSEGRKLLPPFSCPRRVVSRNCVCSQAMMKGWAKKKNPSTPRWLKVRAFQNGFPWAGERGGRTNLVFRTEASETEAGSVTQRDRLSVGGGSHETEGRKCKGGGGGSRGRSPAQSNQISTAVALLLSPANEFSEQGTGNPAWTDPQEGWIGKSIHSSIHPFH